MDTKNIDTHTLDTLNKLTQSQPRPGHGVQDRLDKPKNQSFDVDAETDDRIHPTEPRTAHHRTSASVSFNQITLVMLVTRITVILLVTILVALVSR